MSEQGTLFGMCAHPRTAIVPEHRGPHNAKQVCSDCGKFLGWIPKPETVKQRQENAEILTLLSKIELPSWERQFVRHMASHKNISPKQQAWLWELKDKYLGKEAAHDGFDGEKMSPDGNPPNHL